MTMDISWVQLGSNLFQGILKYLKRRLKHTTKDLLFLFFYTSEKFGGNLSKTAAPLHPFNLFLLNFNKLSWVQIWVHHGCSWVQSGCR